MTTSRSLPSSAGAEHRYLRPLAHVALFLVGAAALCLHEGYGIGISLLWLTGLLFWSSHPRLSGDGQRLLAVFLIYGLVNALLLLWREGPGSDAFKYLQFALIAPLAWAVLQLRLSAMVWFAGMATGALAAFVMALHERLLLGLDRAAGYMHPIQFGNIGLLLGVMSLLGLLYSRGRPGQRSLDAIFLLGATAGCLTSVLSASRGGWIALPVVAWLLWRAFAPFLTITLRRGLPLLLTAALALLVVLPQSGILARVQAAQEEVMQYVDDGRFGPSLGQRFLMWSQAGEMIRQQPLLGLGREGFRAERDRLMASGAWPLVKPFPHLHNDFIDMSVKQGLPAGFILLAVLLLPILVFRRDSRHADPGVRSLAVAGMLLPVLFIGFGLSEVMLGSKAGRVIYLGWLPVIYALYRNELLRFNAAARG